MNNPISDKLRVGDLLVENMLITEDQLYIALEEQKKTGSKLGKTLIELGFVDELLLLNTLSTQLNIPFVDLTDYDYKLEDVRLLDEITARRFRVLVLSKDDNKVTVAMTDPSDIFSLDEVAKYFDMSVAPVIVRENQLLDVLALAYDESKKIASLAKAIDNEFDDDALDIDRFVETATANDAPVAKLLLKIFEDAIHFNVSDIHIEPDEFVLRIRQRIDGVLSEQVLNESRVAAAVIVKLKLMSGLDISEKRMPQDGRFNIKVHGKNVDIRISTMPVQYGESVVMRVLVLNDTIKQFHDIGMTDQQITLLRQSIHQPYGLILVTGPTGSGKTTSLYAALAELNQPEKKIITVEDPVEYRLPRLNQVQINEKIGLDFPRVLKSALRQDPDILLVGEIRDYDSAEIALRAAMTGHLVLSTLHTNDAASTALRLIDMGVDPYLVASSVKTIVAQRLLRRLCQFCKEKNTQEQIAQYEHLIDKQYSGIDFYRPAGCSHCHNVGYRGRIGVFELLIMTADLAAALRVGNIHQFTELVTQAESHITLQQSAISLAVQGIVSLADVQAIAVE